MTLLEYGLRFAQKFNTNYNYMFISLSMVLYTIQNTDISLVEVSFKKKKQANNKRTLIDVKERQPQENRPKCRPKESNE